VSKARVRILFDQGTPAPLRHHLAAHSVSTSFELGWEQLDNGALLLAAEQAGFEVFVTTDKNLRFQQNLSGRQLAILVLPFASWRRLRAHAGLIAIAIDALKPSDYVEIMLP